VLQILGRFDELCAQTFDAFYLKVCLNTNIYIYNIYTTIYVQKSTQTIHIPTFHVNKMGNTIITRDHNSGYDAYIHFTCPFTQHIYTTIYEFGGLDALICAIKHKHHYHYNKPLYIKSYNNNLRKVGVFEYADTKNVRIMHISSANKEITTIVRNEILQMLKWVHNHKIKLIRPRCVIPCTDKELRTIMRRRGNGLTLLEHTEYTWGMHITYNKQMGGLAVCSRSKQANKRVKNKIEEIKALM
jgi:hypothetical protein